MIRRVKVVSREILNHEKMNEIDGLMGSGAKDDGDRVVIGRASGGRFVDLDRNSVGVFNLDSLLVLGRKIAHFRE